MSPTPAQRIMALQQQGKLSADEAKNFRQQEQAMRLGFREQPGVAGLASAAGLTIQQLLLAQAIYVPCHADRHDFPRNEAFLHRQRTKGGWSEFQICRLCETKRVRMRDAGLRVIPGSYQYKHPQGYRLGGILVSKNDWELIGQYIQLLSLIAQLEITKPGRKLHAV